MDWHLFVRPVGEWTEKAVLHDIGFCELNNRVLLPVFVSARNLESAAFRQTLAQWARSEFLRLRGLFGAVDTFVHSNSINDQVVPEALCDFDSLLLVLCSIYSLWIL